MRPLHRRDMGKTSKKSIDSTSNRPARRARRGTAAAPETTSDLATAATAASQPAPEAGAAPPASDRSADDVAQLAFHYFAESGYVHGNALDHWLRAETKLTSS